MLMVLDHFFPESMAMSGFMILSLVVFTVINIIAYYLGIRAALSSNKSRFIQLIMVLIVVKMFIAVAMVVGYVKMGQPASKLFVLPFLILYVIFTIFEVWILLKIARINPASSIE